MLDKQVLDKPGYTVHNSVKANYKGVQCIAINKVFRKNKYRVRRSSVTVYMSSEVTYAVDRLQPS